MNSQNSAASILEQVSGQAEGAELYEVRSFELPVTFRAGALESVKAVETAGRALRVISDGRLGFSTTTDLTDHRTLVHNALECALFGDPASFEFPTQQPSPTVQCFDRQVEQLGEQELITQGEEVIDRIKAYDPGLQIDFSITKNVETVALLNTSGLSVEDRRTSLSAGIEVTRTREDDILIVYDQISSRRSEDLDLLATAERLIERLRWAEETVTVESKAMPIVFTSLGTLCLVLPLLTGLNGRYVYLGASPLGEKLGQQVLDSRFTFLDDGRLDFAVQSAPYDDEGTPTTRKPLIENGVVGQFLYDLRTAAQAQTRPTGNGFKSDGLLERGFHLPPGIASATSVILPGDRSLKEILRDLPEALLVEQILGLGQGNVIAGEFSNNVGLGFLVRNGEIVGRVKNTMIAGNAYDLLKDQLIALSDRAEWFFGRLHAPAIVVDGVGVASKS
jgi:PmbA protein